MGIAVAGVACALLLNTRSASAVAAEAGDLATPRCACRRLCAVARAHERHAALRLMRLSVCWRRSWRRGALASARTAGAPPTEACAYSFRRLPEDEQVALVERLLRRAMASDASSRSARAERPPTAPFRPRTDVDVAAAPVPRSSTPVAPRAAAAAPAAASGGEPVFDLDAQDGWGDAEQPTAPPLALELQKLLPSAKTTPAAAPSPPPPAAVVGPAVSPAAAPVAREQAAVDTLFSATFPAVKPLAVAAAAGVALLLAAAAVWLSRRRAADAPQPQAAPTGDRPAPSRAAPLSPDAVVASEGVDAAAAARRPGVLWARKEKPGGDEPAADADGAAPGVLWTRDARQANDSGSAPAADPAAAGKAAPPRDASGEAAELSDNAEGLRIGARLTKRPGQP